jgi:hypothetical protein
MPRWKNRSGLAVAVGVLVIVGGGVAGQASSALAHPASPYSAGDLVRIAHFAQEEGSLLGVALPGGAAHFIHLVESPLAKIPDPAGLADGETLCVDAHGRYVGKAVRCTITIGTAAHADSGKIAAVVAHEVFHVYQAVMSRTLANFYRAPASWLLEGSAAWVDSDLVSDDPYARAFWSGYFTQPGPLFTRTYSAIGFFGHLASNGVDLWKRFPAIFATTSNAAAYATATLGTSDAFLQNEASVFFRDSSLGSAWDQEDQQYAKFANENVPSPAQVALSTGHAFVPKKLAITANSKPITVTAAPYADNPIKLDVRLGASNPLLTVTVLSGHARIRSTGGGSVDEIDPNGVVICGRASGCSCPGNPTQIHGMFTQGDLAISGGPTGGSVMLSPGTCDLQPRSCVGLLPTADFTETPVITGADYSNGPMTEEPTGNSGQCQAQYIVTGSPADGSPTLTTTEAGLYSIATYPDASAAHQAFETLLDATGWSTEDQPVAGIGDEAYVGDGNGALLVSNDVFDVDWLNPMPDGLTVQQVLQDVVNTLTP